MIPLLARTHEKNGRKTVKALQLENQAMKSEINSVNTMVKENSALLYINDFSNCSKLFDFLIFADDTSLFYSNRSLTELEDDVNNNLKFVSN